MFWRAKTTPRREFKILGHTHGYAVTRVQFNRRGGFKLTTIQNGKEQVLFVPTDPANIQVQWIRQWLIDGNFPEDDDPPPIPPRVLGIPTGFWRSLGAVAISVGTLAGGVAALLAVAPKVCGGG